MNEQLVKEAAWIICPWCDAPKCVGRYNCPSIKEWVERKEAEGEADAEE